MCEMRRSGQQGGGARPGLTDERTDLILLGIILLILGFLLKVAILWTLGIIVLVIGVILYVLGSMGRAVGGRRHYY